MLENKINDEKEHWMWKLIFVPSAALFVLGVSYGPIYCSEDKKYIERIELNEIRKEKEPINYNVFKELKIKYEKLK